MIRAGAGAVSIARRAVPVPVPPDRQHAYRNLIASLFTIVGAVLIGAPWQIVPAGVLAGIIASAGASTFHDRESIRLIPAEGRLSDKDETRMIRSGR